MSLEPATVPIYTPLDAALSTIRLLKLQRDQSGDITGFEEYAQPIILNGHSFPVLDELGRILEVICDNEDLRTDFWWIDFICINQKEGAEEERNSQVQMMKKIYETSTKTIGWLGQGIENGEDAINFIQILRKHRNRLEYQEIPILGEELNDRKQWASLEILLLRPWWTRVWTLQEYVIAKNFVFYCGRQSMDREAVKAATYAVYHCRKIDRTLISDRAFEGAWGRRRLYMWYRAKIPMQLVSLMSYIGDYDSTDARDRVYSVLGVAQDRSLADPPRYQEDLRIVYTELVRSFIHHHNSLDIICLADQFHQKPTILGHDQHQLSLPSWIPDWKVAVRPAVVPVMASQSAGLHIGNLRPEQMFEAYASLYRASGKTRHHFQVEISDDLRTLKCQGIKLGLVDGMGSLKIGEDQISNYFNSTSPTNLLKAIKYSRNIFTRNISKRKHIARIIEKLTLCLLLGRKDRYLGHETPMGHLSDDFLALCIAALRTPTKTHPLFQDWFQRNKSLRFQGFSLEEICVKATVAKKTALLDLNDTSDHLSFLSRFKDTTDYMNRRLITTNSGNIGMSSYRVQKGDQIWILLGCSIPLVLREYEGKAGYEFVGECYLDGYMNGEVMKELKEGLVEVEDIQLV